MIVGNKPNRDLLEKAIKSDKCHHSFLFLGPEKVGKYTIAQTFAHYIVNNSSEFNWKKNNKIDSDINIIEPEIINKKGRNVMRDISVDTIIDANRTMSLAPDKKARVLIIDDAHRMTISAQNALLKTLEEPQDNRYIILITYKADELLETINSRCFSLAFGTVSLKDLKLLYDSDKYIDDVFGRPGFLSQMYDDDEFREIVEYARVQLQQLAKQKTYKRIELASELSKKDDEYLKIFLSVWIYRIWAAAHKTKKFKLIKVADKVEGVSNKIQTTNVNKQLILEDLLINII